MRAHHLLVVPTSTLWAQVLPLLMMQLTDGPTLPFRYLHRIVRTSNGKAMVIPTVLFTSSGAALPEHSPTRPATGPSPSQPQPQTEVLRQVLQIVQPATGTVLM